MPILCGCCLFEIFTSIGIIGSIVQNALDNRRSSWYYLWLILDTEWSAVSFSFCWWISQVRIIDNVVFKHGSITHAHTHTHAWQGVVADEPHCIGASGCPTSPLLCVHSLLLQFWYWYRAACVHWSLWQCYPCVEHYQWLIQGILLYCSHR